MSPIVVHRSANQGYVKRNGSGRSARAGWSLIELLATSLILSFVIASTVALYTIWERQSLMARNYSQAQTDTRTAFRTIMRTVRHGNYVSTVAINAINSDDSHVIVNVPQPGNTAADFVFYTDAGGGLYVQSRTDSSPTRIISGVTAMRIRYFQTVTTGAGNARVATTTEVPGAPGAANQVQIALTVRSGGANNNSNAAVATTTQAFVTLRNTARMHTTSP